MIGTGKFIALTATAMLAAPLPALAAQPQPAQPPTGPAHPLEYAVKFVCGRNAAPNDISTLTASGRFYTAINIHNPGRPQEFTYKIALAGFASAGPMTGFQREIALRYDEALEFDCAWIGRRLAVNQIPVASLITGFLVIQARAELDVVAVYTAAPTTTNQVATMHTERVPVRRVQ